VGAQEPTTPSWDLPRHHARDLCKGSEAEAPRSFYASLQERSASLLDMLEKRVVDARVELPAILLGHHPKPSVRSTPHVVDGAPRGCPSTLWRKQSHREIPEGPVFDLLSTPVLTFRSWRSHDAELFGAGYYDDVPTTRLSGSPQVRTPRGCDRDEVEDTQRRIKNVSSEAHGRRSVELGGQDDAVDTDECYPQKESHPPLTPKMAPDVVELVTRWRWNLEHHGRYTRTTSLTFL
jgi:hypothetical protein